MKSPQGQKASNSDLVARCKIINLGQAPADQIDCDKVTFK